MWIFIKKFKWSVVLFSVFSIIDKLLALMPVIVFYFLFEAIIKNEQNTSYALLISLIALGYIASLLSSVFLNFLKHKLSLIFQKSIRLEFANKLLRMNYREYNNNNPGKYLSWIINDSKNMTNYSVIALIDFMSSIFFIFLTLILWFIFNWVIALVLLSLLIIYLFLPKMFEKYTKLAKKANLEALEKFNASVKNILDGYLILFLNNKKNLLPTKIKKESEWISSKEIHYGKIISLFSNLSLLFSSYIGFIVIVVNTLIIVGLVNVQSNLFLFTPSISILIFDGLLNSNFFANASIATNNFLQLRTSNNLFDKLTYDNKNTKQFLEFDETFNSYTLKNVSYKYQDKEVLKNFSYVFQKNKKYAIIGESGVGKSTILKILLGINFDYTGSAKINDFEIKDVSYSSLFNYVNYLDTANYLFDANVYDNISVFDKNTSEQKINSILNSLELKELIGNNSSLTENDKNLSTGQKQRLDIARKLFHYKPILIVDEGFANIDNNNAVKIEKMLLEKKDLTFIYVTHHLKSVNKNLYDDIICL